MKEDSKVMQQTRSKKIREGDQVLITAGNNKGKSGTVLSVNADKVIVRGVNIRKRHMRGNGPQSPGRIIEREKPVHVSNMALCTADNKPIKLKTRVNSEGERELYYLDGDKSVLYRQIKKK